MLKPGRLDQTSMFGLSKTTRSFVRHRTRLLRQQYPTADRTVRIGALQRKLPWQGLRGTGRGKQRKPLLRGLRHSPTKETASPNVRKEPQPGNPF